MTLVQIQLLIEGLKIPHKHECLKGKVFMIKFKIKNVKFKFIKFLVHKNPCLKVLSLGTMTFITHMAVTFWGVF